MTRSNRERGRQLEALIGLIAAMHFIDMGMKRRYGFSSFTIRIHIHRQGVSHQSVMKDGK